ncbi:actin-like [Physella acuta]|uniref:actin-like n=1 Tax=Physella acuta TaxID=109671 RepID=UPI0027DD55A3|nr:actin-like [Physella acuta]
MMYDGRVLVIDNGSNTCKAGFAGDDVPSVTFSSLVSRRRFEVREFRPGVVVNWDDAEYIWKRVYNKLKVFSQDHPVLLTGSCHSPQASREKVAEIMFETFRTPALYLANQSVLALYASGRLDGAVLYCGESVTEVVPVSEGEAVDLAITRFDVSGRDLTEYLNTLLTERIINFARNSNRDVVQNIKEQRCYVASKFDKEMWTRYCKKTYTLPDGQVITLEQEMFKCPESLFQPSIVFPNYLGIHEATHNSIMKCSDVDTDLRQYMFSNNLLAGGSTMFPGFADRLQKEIATLAPRSVKVKVLYLSLAPDEFSIIYTSTLCVTKHTKTHQLNEVKSSNSYGSRKQRDKNQCTQKPKQCHPCVIKVGMQEDTQHPTTLGIQKQILAGHFASSDRS